MVKAFSYGSGSFEIANVLQFQKVDYLAVAYADEGIALRQGGITLPVMVMNTDAAAFDALIQYKLEPDLYNPVIYRQFYEYCESSGVSDVPVHLEVETGMNRLGFAAHELSGIRRTPIFRVVSVFSHLVASDEPGFDDFTNEQAERFRQMTSIIESNLGHPVIKHLANTSGASRHPHLQLDMVRLGIGLYGIDAGISAGAQLREVSTLKTTVSHISFAGKNETVGYGRRGRLSHDSVIATVRIGYADGYSRRFGNGRGRMLVNGKHAPVVGSVCMDMTMLDITGIENVSVGNEVVVFGSDLSVNELAQWGETIPYEILTGVSQRVKRVYFEQ
jgi:alanine racemase